jgi:diguanylate cyclase (GGDEF)-like protein
VSRTQLQTATASVVSGHTSGEGGPSHATAIRRAQRQARERRARQRSARGPVAAFVPVAALASPIARATLPRLVGAPPGGGAGAGSAPASGSPTAGAAGVLAPGLPTSTGLGIAKSGPGQGRRTASGGGAPPPAPPAAPSPRRLAPLTRVINAIPTTIWFALGALLALAVAFGSAAIVATTRWRRREDTIRTMEGLASTDALTGVLTRGAFEERLRGELARARRYGRPLGLLTFDVAGLKAVNDAHGHRAGDDVLRAVAAAITHTIRDHDLCGRMGGDEYAVLVTEQGRNGTEKVLQRIAAQMQHCRSELGLRTDWGVSAGIASFPRDGDTARQLLDAADRRLYLSRGIRIEPAS